MIEILPFCIGLHRGMSDTFNILEFPRPPEDVIYFEDVREANFSHDLTDGITVYRELFEDLRDMSLGPKGTLEYQMNAAGRTRKEQEAIMDKEPFGAGQGPLARLVNEIGRAATSGWGPTVRLALLILIGGAMLALVIVAYR